ncbi:MAG: ribosome biogenesis GTPase Der [bacterium]|nr:ribosome biogenesis GTPase Der [bacterium]MDE0500839.1 ribosome biogenesis GTPase Der [bacterium]
MSSERLAVVAVVGRPNVGKSTLINRIIGRRAAVVQSEPGVTRDRRIFTAEWADRRFLLVDTGGWERDPSSPFSEAIRHQAEAAVSGADAVLFVVDGTAALGDDDEGMAAVVKRSGVPAVMAANKIDNPRREMAVAEYWSLGLGEPHPVSAIHGRGVGDLLDEVLSVLPEREPHPADEPFRIAIVGRPNTGKSTLLNRLCGSQRVIVSDVPGTTRDPVDVDVELDGVTYRLVDTAGIRRRPRNSDEADYYAVLRARDALSRADAALLVVDALEGATYQDQKIARAAAEAGTALVVLLNKWDAIDPEQREWTEESIPDRLGFISWAPVLRLSALTGARIGRLGAALEMVLENAGQRVPTGELNRLVAAWVAAQPPPPHKGRRCRIMYAVQAGVRPPTMVLFTVGSRLIPEYLRYLERKLREQYDLVGTPVRFVTRRRTRNA